MKKAIVLLSGGMDSSTLAYYLARDQMYEPICIGVNYGQRHRRELAAAAQIADSLGARFTQVDLSDLGQLLRGSALTDQSVAVPHGHYAAPTMKQTVVPNRNAILLNIAVGAAVAEEADIVATAVHAGDHAIYPDCRPEFIDAMNILVSIANEGFHTPRVMAPFEYLTKTEIAVIGANLGVPYRLTWSCYEGNEVHCGRCGTCVERREAFRDANIADPTPYAEGVSFVA
jgi:7-cyano-7-deazaguanine synthase